MDGCYIFLLHIVAGDGIVAVVMCKVAKGKYFSLAIPLIVLIARSAVRECDSGEFWMSSTPNVCNCFIDALKLDS